MLLSHEKHCIRMLIKWISLGGSHWLIREKTNLINIDTMFYNPLNAFIKPSDDNKDHCTVTARSGRNGDELRLDSLGASCSNVRFLGVFQSLTSLPRCLDSVFPSGAICSLTKL